MTAAIPMDDPPGAAAAAPAQAAAPPLPVLGIASVLVGLSISVFFGQFLGAGLPDLRGNLHLSVDQGAWLPAAFNGGQMFMGPLSVYLGGLAGARKVLMVASGVVAAASALIPFSSSYGMLLTLLVIVGLAAGCFYPLTLTYILRAAPPRLIFIGIACYTIDAIGGTHLATAAEGWYIEHMSWRWLFWHFSLAAPVMFLLVSLGMPRKVASKQEKKLEASWRGFLYASCGLTTIYVALTQGERLNWFHSGVIVGLFAAGGFLLVGCVWRHFVQPLPLIDFSLLGRYNVIVMSLCLVIFRFSLLASVTIVPSFLGTVQGFRPEQIGPVLAIVTAPMLVVGLLSALSLRYVHPRVILACGFALMAVACLWDQTLTSAWAAENFVPAEMFLGVGLAMTIAGLVGSIVITAVNSDALSQPVRALTVAAWFHTVRLMGGQLGVVALGRLLDVREKFHSNMLGQSVSLGSPVTMQQLLGSVRRLSSASGPLDIAVGRSAALLHGRIAKQAYTLACIDGYTVISIVLGCGLVLAACMREEPITFERLLSGGKEPA